MVWAMENPWCHLTEPDDIPYDRVIELARPYLGEIVGAHSDWTPLVERGVLFPEDVDTTDPWQFKKLSGHVARRVAPSTNPERLRFGGAFAFCRPRVRMRQSHMLRMQQTGVRLEQTIERTRAVHSVGSYVKSTPGPITVGAVLGTLEPLPFRIASSAAGRQRYRRSDADRGLGRRQFQKCPNRHRQFVS